MRKLLLCLLIASAVGALLSCKKTIDNKKEDFVLGIMTRGQWFLESYLVDGVNLTDDFKGQVFQFYEGGRLDATLNTIVKTGNWSGDINKLTLTVLFSIPGDVLQNLNYTWQWTDAHVGLVFAETVTVAGKKISIRLRRL